MNRFVDVFRGKEDLLNEAADFNPLDVEINERMKIKYTIEDEKFDSERYAYDNFDDEQIEQVNAIMSIAVPK